MSWSLVRRGLELCEEHQQQGSKNKRCKEGTGRKLSRHQKEKRAAKQRKAVEFKNIKSLFTHKQPVSAIEKYRQNAPKDRTEDNIKLLKKIDKKKTPQQYVEKILEQHSKQLEARVPTQQEAEQTKGKNRGKKEASLFSDEDFDKMNKEWLKLY